jgi:hypothetical protein
MVNAVADAVKTVHSDNLVIAGGTAPFRDLTPSVFVKNRDWGPLTFMRQLLCLSKALRPTCHKPVRFDIWAHHPYTSGGPTHHAVLPDDISLGDLPKMQAVLAAGAASGEIQSQGKVRFWVTEFSWDSNPPDPAAVPMWLLKRWVPEALYRMWATGISLVTWFSLDDVPAASGYYQGGLYFQRKIHPPYARKPKPIREAFRFPVVAFPRANGVYVWGRTPGSSPARVEIEQRAGVTWRKLGAATASATGIFQRVFATHASGFVRARIVSTNEASLAFSLTAPPDRFFNPFGSTGPLEPGKH